MSDDYDEDKEYVTKEEFNAFRVTQTILTLILVIGMVCVLTIALLT